MDIINEENQINITKKILKHNFNYYCKNYNKTNNNIDDFIDFLYNNYNDECTISDIVKALDEDEFNYECYYYILSNKEDFSDEIINEAYDYMSGLN